MQSAKCQVQSAKCKLGKGKEFLLKLAVWEAGFPSESGAGHGILRLHEVKACEVALL